MPIDSPKPLPVLRLPLSRTPIAWVDGHAVSRQRFLDDVRRVAAKLPRHAFVINLCDARYHFLVAFAAAAGHGQTTLLPATRLEQEVADVAAHYTDSYHLADADIAAWRAGQPDGGDADPPIPTCDAGRVAAIAFTSGSTGRSQPSPKQWGELVQGARLAERRFLTGILAEASIVATTPPQHMYGLETSIMVPLMTAVSVSGARPFFPADIRNALKEVPSPRLLITTPAHLRVAVAAGLDWPQIDLVISATAPLAKDLATMAERVLAAPVMEIFGFTEAGSVASRRTVEGDEWTLYDGLRIEGDSLVAQHLSAPVHFADVIERRGDNGFVWVGRKKDLINVAGKRTSLAFLNQQLTAIDGVEDGVFILPPYFGTRSARLLALVVAPTMTRDKVLTDLRRRIDPLFLPRPLLMVEALPRNETGKLRQDELRVLMKRLGVDLSSADGDNP